MACLGETLMKTYKSEVAGKFFTCTCGGRGLEEVMVCVTEISPIRVVEMQEVFGGANADVDYFDVTSESGDLDAIRCAGCGKAIADNYEELLKMSQTDERFTPIESEGDETNTSA